MRDIPMLDKTLLQSDFELARTLYGLMRGQGYAPLKAAAMVYRHGYLDGWDGLKQHTRERQREQQERRELRRAEEKAAIEATDTTNSPPEAIEEGSDINA